jgi:hypothetical protein
MIIQNRELEELQARIREAEERLKSRGSVLLERKPSDAHGDGGYQSTGKLHNPSLQLRDYLTSHFVQNQRPRQHPRRTPLANTPGAASTLAATSTDGQATTGSRDAIPELHLHASVGG